MMRFPRAALAALTVLLALTGCKDGTGSSRTGGLTIEITGLPGGTNAAVTVTGPGGFSRTLAATETLADLKGGEYTIKVSNVAAGGVSYGALEETQTVSLDLGATKTVQIAYVNVNTTLSVSVRGLPAGTTPSVRVTGPNGFDRTISGSAKLGGLAEGTYTIAAAGFVRGDSTYQARPARLDYVMTGTFPGQADIVYSAAGHRSLNFRVSGLYLLNVVQNPNGTVPLVQNRAAYARVFVLADQANSAAPWVRLRVYNGLALRATYFLEPGSASVATATDDGALERSWNVAIPAELIQPGLRVEAEVDPDNGVPEGNEGDNLFPASGGPLALNVVTPDPLRVRFVPIVQKNGLKGGIDESNKDSYLQLTRKIYPVPSVEADLHVPYVSTGASLDPDIGTWGPLLDEMVALRVAEGNPGIHYMGVVRVNYQSGIAGLAYLPNEFRLGGAALSWDVPSDRSFTVAHELGHNLSRRHSPCSRGVNAPGGVDTQYPRADGLIGVFGYDIAARFHRRADQASDVMGYCPENVWISDYTYEAVRKFQEAAKAASAQARPQSTVLVWGRMDEDGVVLEPAFQITTRPSLPTVRGPYTAEGFDASGAQLFSISFAGEEVADARGERRVFAFAVPLAADRAARLATVRVRGEGRESVVRSTGAAAAAGRPVPIRDQAMTVEAEGNVLNLRWDVREAPMVMVRDAATGQVISFARGGRATLRGIRDDVELIVSDGVRSSSRRVQMGAN